MDMSRFDAATLQKFKQEYDATSQDLPESSDDEEDDNGVDDIFQYQQLTGPASRTISTGLRTTYKPDWGPKEGFRELFQNWRDAITSGNNLTLEKFQPKVIETRRQIIIEVRHPNQEGSPLLGFVRFKWDTDENPVGVLEIANFHANLHLAHLAIGGTTKAHDKKQTVKYGEGLKLAALTFRRHPFNYTFRIESSAYRWNSSFNAHKILQFRLRRVQDETIARMQKFVKNTPRTTKSHVWKDVSIIVGAPGRRKIGEDGVPTRSSKIPLASFRDWMDVALELDPPEESIRTEFGDLILSPSHAKRLYLQGLRLPHGSATGKEFRYGYNLRYGETNRDRECLGNTMTEARNITHIWAEALCSDHGRGNILSRYTSLLMECLNKAPDVMIDGGTQNLDKETATLVWKQMLQKGREDHGSEVFYFSPSEGHDDIQIIQKNLQKYPVPISKDLWKLLSGHGLCRTPMAEQEHRLSHASPVRKLDTPFAQYVVWFLKCCFCLNHLTKDIKWQIVEGRNVGIDVAWMGNAIRIHDRWIDASKAQEGAFSHANHLQTDESFAYDDVVLWLWDLIITQLISSGSHADLVKHERWLKGLARTHLAKAPRRVTCTSTDLGGELAVKWESSDLHGDENSTMGITLHSDDCALYLPASRWQREFSTVQLHGVDNDCTCHSMTSHFANNTGVFFQHLSLEKQYTLEIRRLTEGSFPGLPIDPIAPAFTDALVGDAAIPPDIQLGPLMNDHNVSNMRVFPTSNSISLAISDRVIDLTNVSESSDSGAEAPNIVDAAAKTIGSEDGDHYNQFPILGEKINHSDLQWSRGFPGSHDFYRTRGEPDSDILIALPKANDDQNILRNRRDRDGEASFNAHRSKKPRHV